jgi:hypothetical protein
MHDIKKLETDAMIVGFHEDVRPLKGTAGALDWLLCGALSHLIIDNKIRGAIGDVALLTTKGKIPATKIFLVGLGPRAGASPANLRNAARTAAASAVNAGVSRAAMDCFPQGDGQDDASLAALWKGIAEGAGARSLEVTLLASNAAAFERLSRGIRT